jgi:16S rRNA processing protein RimM
VALAEVLRPHGVGGELRLKVYNLDSRELFGRQELTLVTADGEARCLRVESLRDVPGAVLLRLEGVGDRDAAEALRGARIEVPRDELGPPDEGEYYIADLIGCEVIVGGERLGVVRDVVSYPTCDALVIVRDGAESAGSLEVPLHDAYVEAVDVVARKIVLSHVDESD